MELIVVTLGDIVQLGLLSLLIVIILSYVVYNAVSDRIKIYFCKRKLRKLSDLAGMNPTDRV